MTALSPQHPGFEMYAAACQKCGAKPGDHCVKQDQSGAYNGTYVLYVHPERLHPQPSPPSPILPRSSLEVERAAHDITRGERNRAHQRIEQLIQERDRVHQVLERAPHDHSCGTFYLTACSCWKAGL